MEPYLHFNTANLITYVDIYYSIPLTSVDHIDTNDPRTANIN